MCHGKPQHSGNAPSMLTLVRCFVLLIVVAGVFAVALIVRSELLKKVARAEVDGYGGHLTTDRLDLSGVSIDKASFRELLPKVAAAYDIQAVYLDGSNLGDDSMADLSLLGESVWCVSLADTSISDAGLVPLAQTKNFFYLDLPNTAVTDEGLKILARHGQYISLNLNGTDITDAGLATLAAFHRLKSLELKGTQVSDDGMVYLEGLTKISKLNLEDTDISDRGMVHLKPLVNLYDLSLQGTDVTIVGLRELHDHKKLRFLSVDAAKVSSSDVYALQLHLPKKTYIMRFAEGRVVK